MKSDRALPQLMFTWNYTKAKEIGGGDREWLVDDGEVSDSFHRCAGLGLYLSDFLRISTWVIKQGRKRLGPDHPQAGARSSSQGGQKEWDGAFVCLSPSG